MPTPRSAGYYLETSAFSVLAFAWEVWTTFWRTVLTPRAFARAIQRGDVTFFAPSLAYLIVTLALLAIAVPLLDSPWEDPARLLRDGVVAARQQGAAGALLRALPMLAVALLAVWLLSLIAGTIKGIHPTLRALVFYSVG